MDSTGKPGPKPKRLYLRLVQLGSLGEDELPKPRNVREHLANLDRVGRLVAHGELTQPAGDLLILRATDLREAERILRADPFRSLEGTSYTIYEWRPGEYGTGVNLEPPPALGSGRLTQLQRITIVVRDQTEALNWYESVLGFKVQTKDPDTGYVELALGKGAVAISLVAPRPDWGEPYYSETLSRVGSATGIAFRTDSVRALELRLRHAGARITQPPEGQPWGGVTLRFSDPDGNEFLAFQTESERIPDSPGEPARSRGSETRSARHD